MNGTSHKSKDGENGALNSLGRSARTKETSAPLLTMTRNKRKVLNFFFILPYCFIFFIHLVTSDLFHFCPQSPLKKNAALPDGAQASFCVSNDGKKNETQPKANTLNPSKDGKENNLNSVGSTKGPKPTQTLPLTEALNLSMVF